MAIKYYIIAHLLLIPLLLFTATSKFSKGPEKKPFTILFDPAGDTQHTGRKVDDRYERSITLQYAQEIKKRCDHVPGLNIIITRTAGYTRTELDTAQLANRIQADLVIFFSAAHRTEGPTTITLYRFCNNPFFLPQPPHQYSFVPCDQAYIKAAAKTEKISLECKQLLTQEDYRRLFDVKGPFAIPHKPLIGIQVPALSIELELKHGSDWQALVSCLVHTLSQLPEKIGNIPHV